MDGAPPASRSGGAARTRLLAAAVPALFVLLAAAPPASGPPGPAQLRRLARILACPERLPDDRARIRNTDRFMAAYARLRPGSRAGERVAVRDRLLARKGCRPAANPLLYTSPET